MPARPNALAARLLPRGWADLGRQLLLVGVAYYLYRLVRGLVDGRAAQAFANAREIIHFEQSLNLFVEPAVHAWASEVSWLIDTLSWMYVNSHFRTTVCALAWIYVRRNDSFYFVRNMFMAAMGLALVAYVLFPTAPPRLMPEWGFGDPVASLTAVAPGSGAATILFNPFAAVPSMHVCFALMLGVPMSRMVRSGAARTLWLAYPVMVSFVVVATANHWWFDAVAGVAVAAVSPWVASQLVRAAPHAWAFQTPFQTRHGGATA